MAESGGKIGRDWVVRVGGRGVREREKEAAEGEGRIREKRKGKRKKIF